MRETSYGIEAAGRRVPTGLLAALIAACGLLAAASPALAGNGGDGDGDDGDIDALVLRDAASPVLKKLDGVAELDAVRHTDTKRRRPERFDVLIVDGDTSSPKTLRMHRLLDRFIGAERWVAAFDVDERDLEALSTYTGFDTARGANRSEAHLFRVSNVEGTPTIEIVDSGPLGRGTGKLGKRHSQALKRKHASRVARLIDDSIGAPGEAAARTAAFSKVSCPPLEPAPDPDLQHVGWCYTDAGYKAVPKGFWTQEEKRWWIDSYGPPGSQTATWTMNHRFDVFLNNDPARPRGNFNTVTYALTGQFTPKRANESFFRMNDLFTSGWHGQRRLERAWWTGDAKVTVDPSNATDGKLVWQGSHPANANSETNYTSGEEFSVGFSGTGARPDAGLGGGVSFNYTASNSKSYSIPDWGVENRTSGNQLQWLFNARQPCDTRAGRDRGDCFDRQFGFIGPWQPTVPSDLSRGQLQINTSGRWRTKEALADTDRLVYGIDTPIQLVDTYCDGEFIGGWCGAGRSKYRTSVTGPTDHGIYLDAGWVNPIPIKRLTLSPDPAKGANNQKVTGTIVLERKATVPVNIRILSNSGNAVVGAPAPGIAGGSQNSITIDPDQDTGTFTVATNDNGLAPGARATASITAFYAEATTQQLRVQGR